MTEMLDAFRYHQSIGSLLHSWQAAYNKAYNSICPQAPLVHSMNAAIINTMAERIAELGGIPAQRIQIEPAPGTATVEDLARYNETHSPLCELIV